MVAMVVAAIDSVAAPRARRWIRSRTVRRALGKVHPVAVLAVVGSQPWVKAST